MMKIDALDLLKLSLRKKRDMSWRTCIVCSREMKVGRGFNSHMRMHIRDGLAERVGIGAYALTEKGEQQKQPTASEPQEPG